MSASGLIVAGGRSVRMGRPKALVEVAGVPMICRVARALREVCDDLTVAGGPARLAAIVDARHVEDLIPDAGPVAGLAAGLAAAPGDRCVVLGTDMPFVDPRALRFLLAVDPDAEVVVPRVGGRSQPLHAVYRTDAAPGVRRALEDGVRRMSDITQMLRARYVEEPAWRLVDPELRSCWSVDTPEELALAELVAAGRRPE